MSLTRRITVVGSTSWSEIQAELAEARYRRAKRQQALTAIGCFLLAFLLVMVASLTTGCSTESEAPANDAGSDTLTCELPPPCDLSDDGTGAARVQTRIWCGEDACGRKVAACDGPIGDGCAINPTRLCAASCAGGAR